MTNPCCTECGTYKMMSNGNKDYSTIICTDPACECHKSANCPECHFEPENGHALTCSKYVPRVCKSVDYLKVKTTEYKPKGELTDDFVPTDTAGKCTCDKPSIISGHRLWCEACTFNKLPTDTSEEWKDLEIKIEHLKGEGDLLWIAVKAIGGDVVLYDEKRLKAFIASEKQRSFEEGRKYTEAADKNTYMEAYEIGKEAGHAAALSKVKELAEGMKKPYEHHFGVGADSVVMAHNNALSDLLDHLKTIE